MKVAVTGGLGFIGERLVDTLVKRKYEVAVLDIRKPQNVNNLNPNIELKITDVTNFRQVTKALGDADVVYHLAGTVLNSARKNPHDVAKLDVLGTANVLEACCTNGIEKIVYASSFYLYDGMDENLTVDESSNASNFFKMELFGVSKLIGERLAKEYNKKHGLGYVILRFGPAYGPNDRCSSVVYTFIKAGLKGEPIVVWGQGNRKNQYTYVDDIAQGCALAIKETNETFNLISPIQRSIRQLAIILQEKYGFKVTYDRSREEGPSLPYISPNKAIKRLGWNPITLDEGIDKTYKGLQKILFTEKRHD